MHVSAALSARMIVSRHQASLVSSTSSSYDALLACDQEPHTRHARVQLLLGLQKVTTIGEQKGPLEGNDGTSYGSTHVLNPTHAHHTAPLVDAPAEPLKPEMNARRLSASAGYSLKSRLKSEAADTLLKKKKLHARSSSLGTTNAPTWTSGCCINARRRARRSDVSTRAVPIAPMEAEEDMGLWYLGADSAAGVARKR